MKDTRPLSERFDLGYVRRKHFADRWTGKLGLVLALASAAWFGLLAARGDDTPYSSGPLTTAHDMFASKCEMCHAPNMQRGKGYFLPATDEKCLGCHENSATIHAENQNDLFAGNAVPGHPDMRLSSNCTSCHVEHRGHDVNLSAIADSICIRCHSDLEKNGKRLQSSPGTRSAPVGAEVKPAAGGVQ